MSEKDITIDKEFAALIPPLTVDELAGLEENLLRDGIRDALVVWDGKNILLDGHNRYRLAQQHSLAYRTKALKFESREDAMLWVINNQRGRRNISDDQRATLALEYQEIESVIAKRERAKDVADARWHPKACVSADVSDTHKPKKDTRKKAAKAFKVSERKVKQAAQVKKHAPEMLKKVHDGEMPLAAAVREVKRAELKTKLSEVAAREIEAPTGKYDVIVIDPPWQMEKIERDVRPNQSEFDYPTMSEEQLAERDIPYAEHCHVWLWTTQRFLPSALRLLEAWKLDYVCTFVWHKPGGFQPIGLPQYNCEFALYARRGSPQFIDTKAFNVCFEAPRGKHSEKPEEFYALLRRVTGGRRLDMFNRRQIDGFTAWGKEA